MNARANFDALADALLAEAAGNEVLLLGYYAEDSDFVRLNHARVRQAGHVSQRELRLELVCGARHASIDLQLQGNLEADLALTRGELAALRALLPNLPEDPYLDYAKQVNDSESVVTGTLGDRAGWLDGVADCTGDLDLVGLLAVSGVNVSNDLNDWKTKGCNRFVAVPEIDTGKPHCNGDCGRSVCIEQSDRKTGNRARTGSAQLTVDPTFDLIDVDGPAFNLLRSRGRPRIVSLANPQ